WSASSDGGTYGLHPTRPPGVTRRPGRSGRIRRASADGLRRPR
ncbi:MAG: hypothetical protein AVDCRST_MAG69-1871, partial [uncultured Solirubrobacteraceae bacterium]